jgi:hypothetical protein
MGGYAAPLVCQTLIGGQYQRASGLLVPNDCSRRRPAWAVCTLSFRDFPGTERRQLCCAGCLEVLKTTSAQPHWQVLPLTTPGAEQSAHASRAGRAEQPAARRRESAKGGFWAALREEWVARSRQPPCQMCIGGECSWQPEGRCTRQRPGGPAHWAYLTGPGLDPETKQRTPCCEGCIRKYVRQSREPHPERRFEPWTNPPRRRVVMPSGGRALAVLANVDPTTPEYRYGWVD